MRFAPFLAISAILLAGCQAAPGDDVEISHVHGLAYDATSGSIYVATHHGLIKGSRTGTSWDWNYAGNERYDYMGFTQDLLQPGTFYSSGHPDDPRAFGGTNLGLRRSTDGGATWEQRSLKGQVDFHAMTSQGSGEGHLAAYWQGAIKTSTDGGFTWRDEAAGLQVYALAGSNDYLWAGTPGGILRTSDNATWESVGQLPGAVTSLAVSHDGQRLLASTGDGRTGSTHRSSDGGASWKKLDPDGLRDASAPVLFAYDASTPGHAFASTAGGGIFESRDDGATWSTIRTA